MKSATNNRQPAVAGQFYPRRPAALEQSLDACFAKTRAVLDKPVRALICPHAGYVFSGGVAAMAIAQLNHPYKRVILLGASHQLAFNGVSVFCSGDFNMPYGVVPVDKTVGKALVMQYPHLFNDDPALQLQEHSLEVLLPLLHRKLGDHTPIVPILIGTIEPYDCKQVAMALKPWFTPDNLFIISTDFSHYPDSEQAKRLDAETMEAICSNQPAQLEKVLGTFPQPHVNGLVTRLCGWRAVLTMMHLTTQMALTYHPLTYAHSGDNPLYGEADRVVGYWAIAITEKSLKTETANTQAEVRVNDETSTDGSYTLTATAKTTRRAWTAHG
jgi:AmmeMemoRadiSam system protein B